MEAKRRVRAKPKQWEEVEQKAVIAWSKVQFIYIEEIRFRLNDFLIAIPNGGSRHKLEAANLKAAGVKAGVSDLFLSLPVGGYHGLYVEMKSTRDHKPTVSKEQKEWLAKAQLVGYRAEVAYGAEEAKGIITQYMEGVEVG